MKQGYIKRLKIGDIKVRRNFQADRSTFRGVFGHRKNDQNFEIILSPHNSSAVKLVLPVHTLAWRGGTLKRRDRAWTLKLDPYSF